MFFLLYRRPTRFELFLKNEWGKPTRISHFFNFEWGKFSLSACEIVLKVKLPEIFEQL